MKKTKIVCTIGPTSESDDILEKLMICGMNLARLNFSHGDYEEHKKRIKAIKRVREKLDYPVGILLDTKGPEIRLEKFKDGKVQLKKGQRFTLTTREVLGDNEIVGTGYEGLPKDVNEKDIILIDDGLIEMEVVEIVDETDIICIVKNNGTLTDHKGVNVPGVKTNMPAVTEKDINDIEFGIENGIDFIAASFIRKASDVLEIRKILEQNNADYIEIIAKIENQEAVDNIDDIINASDGIMVARGDLGVEITTEEIPLIQKDIIRKCNKAGKPVITATQMLDSMMRNPRPTRAEVNDVANAILDGSDAIMLSGETAAGKYPIESVKTMRDIALRTEASLDYREILHLKALDKEYTTTNAISRATCTIAEDLGASAILTATSSGNTAKAVSKFRPKAPIVAATTSRKVMRKLSLTWGVHPTLASKSTSTDEVIDMAIHSALEKKYIKEGDLIVITAGIPVAVSGSTNLLKVHTVGEILLKGIGIGNKAVTGKVCIGNTPEELENKFEDGDILVSMSTNKDMVEYMKKASAIVTEEGGLTSHAAIVGFNVGRPTIVGAHDGTKLLKDGELITVDSITGLIYRGEARVL